MVYRPKSEKRFKHNHPLLSCPKAYYYKPYCNKKTLFLFLEKGFIILFKRYINGGDDRPARGHGRDPVLRELPDVHLK